mgnify:CR=1 FL=1
MTLAVSLAASLISWTFVIASFSLDGKPRELCLLASFAVIAFHVGWCLSGKTSDGWFAIKYQGQHTPRKCDLGRKTEKIWDASGFFSRFDPDERKRSGATSSRPSISVVHHEGLEPSTLGLRVGAGLVTLFSSAL